MKHECYQFVFSWKDAEWLCSEWKGPRAIKVNVKTNMKVKVKTN